MSSRLVHPKMAEVLKRDFYHQSCALKRPVKTQSTTGKEKRAYETAPGCDALPCRVAPASGGERRGDRYTHLDATHIISIPQQFDELSEEWIAVVEGQSYEILLPSRDAEGLMTRLETRIAR